jgi:hypothetical protein
VAEVFPELVAFNKAGQPDTVAYHILPALLLNEVQKAHQQLETEHTLYEEQSEKLGLLQKQFDTQSAQLIALEKLTRALAAQVARSDEERARTLLVAQ